MTFFIPARDLPQDIVRVTDPTTGAKYWRRRPKKTPKTPNNDSQVHPLPATCWTPFCEKAGLPHEGGECAGDPLPFDPYYSVQARYAPLIGNPVYSPFIHLPPVRPDFRYRGDQDAFQRWLRSFPHWQMPREMPTGWVFPSQSEQQSRIGSSQRRYTPFRAAGNLPQVGPVLPEYAVPSIPLQSMPTPWPSVSAAMNRVPNSIEWDNVQGGRLQWTPHPWIAHPLPHPDMPAHAFWDFPGNNGTLLESWRGPGGWSPRYGMDDERLRMLTGGHPLPGMDPRWTPTLWVPPLYSPQIGVYLSPWLAANPRNANVPHILWDTAVEPPNKIRRVTSRGDIVDFASTDFFKQAATEPAVKTLRIFLPGMRTSWGPVVINKDELISVGDVFNAVWEYLHKPITQSDWTGILESHGEQRRNRIAYAMYRRCQCAAALYDYMVSQGVKRVDLLEGGTVYWGTWLVYNVDYTWSLCMGFLPKGRMA